MPIKAWKPILLLCAILSCAAQALATAPSITSLTPSTGAVGASVTIAGANFGSPQGSSTVKFNGTTATATSWSATSITVTVPSGATTGNVVVNVGGTNSNGSSFTVVSAPSITSLSVTTGAVGATVVITGTSFGSSQGSGTVKFNGTAATVTSWSATSVTVTVPSGATTGNVVVFASGVNSNGKSFTVVSAPGITSLSITTGAVGATVVITGTNFGSSQGSGTVKFNGTAATVTSWSATSITVTVPSGATTGNVVVFASGVNSNGSSFTVVSAPSITTLSITTGAAGATVVITGTNFGSSQGSGTVKFNGTAATVTSWSATSIAVTVPTGATTGNVVVFASGVNSNGSSFTIVSAPSITSLSVTSGAVGAAVTITGTNFGSSQGSGNVTFNGTTATASSWSATSIAVTVPAGATTGNVVVFASGVNSNGSSFTVVAAPSLTSLSITSGMVGEVVMLTGANFGTSQGSGTVKFNGTTATATTWGATSITVAVPSGATTGNVVVTADGVASNGILFTVTLLPTGWSDTDIGAVGLAGSASYSNGTFTINASGSGVYSTTDQVHFAYQSLSGDGTIVARVVSFQGATYPQAGVMVRNSLAANDMSAFTSYESTTVYFWDRATTGGSTTYQYGSGGALPYWVKLVRSGSTFSSYMAPDGVNWVQVGTAQTISMAQNVDIGLAVSSNSNTTLTAATFDNVSISTPSIPAPIITTLSATTGPIGSQVVVTGSGFGASQSGSVVMLNGAQVTINSWINTSITVTIPTGATSGPLLVSVAPSMNDSNYVVFTVTSHPLPNGWLDQDIGPVGIAGSATFANEKFAISASGNGVYSTADQVHFVYQPLSGDGSIVARVVSFQGGSYPQAGVMIRNTLAADDMSAFTSYESTAVYFWDRSTTGGSTTYQYGSGGALPYWVGLVRAGNTFTSFMALDGVNWVQVGTTQTIPMAQNVYIGMAVSSNSDATSTTATFDNVSLNTLAAAAPVITGLSATTGPIGSQVLISGTGFGASQSTSLVTLNGALVTINAWSNTSITITIPTGATSGPLLVSVAPGMNDSNYVVFTVTSQPLPNGWLDQDIGPVGIAGNATFANEQFTINASGTGVVYSTADQIHFAYQSLSGNGTIVARVVSLTGTGAPEAGVMIRNTLAEGSMSAFAAYEQSSIYYWYRAATGASTSVQDVSAGALPYWVKLVRNGSNFSGYYAPDGVNWVQVGTTQTIPMAQNVYIGLAATSNSNTTLATATFDNVSISTTTIPSPVITGLSATTGSIGSQVVITGVGFGVTHSGSVAVLNGTPVTVNAWSNTSITVTIPSGATTGPLLVSVAPDMNDSNYVEFTVTTQPLPAGWLDQDVGTVGLAGSATYSSPVFTVNGSGQGLFYSADQFHFVYQPLLGDGTIIARVATQTGDNSPVAGVMIRETLNTGATSAFVGYRSTTMFFMVRTTTGASSNYQTGTGGSLPYWVKLVRSGGTFSAYSSTNGTTWVQVGTTQTISMAQNVYIGLAVSSDDNTSLSTATFDNVTFTPGATPNVTSLSPYSVGVGTAVTIYGTDFGTSQGSSSVTFNSLPAASVTSWSNTQIVATVPSGIPEGPGPVVVTVNSLPSNATVLFTAFDPVITSLAPPAAPVGGIVVVNGTGFGPSLNTGQVQFNGVVAHAFLWNDTSISVNVPTNATNGPVNVTVSGFPSTGAAFTVIEALSITGISPSAGSIGSSVTINGAGFGATQSDSVVTFDSVAATVSSWSDTQIVAIVPAGAATGPVTVEVAANTADGPTYEISTSVTLTDSLGHQSTYASEMVGGKWYVNNSQGSGCSSCTVRGNIQTNYDNFGNVILVTDELSHTTSYTYDSNQNLLSVSRQANSGYATTSYTYNSFGEPLTVTDPLGNVTTNTYDTHGNLLTVTTPAPNGSTAASVTQFTYNSLGEMTQITDPLSRITKLAYTTAGLIYTITDPQNNVTTYAYDTEGDRTSVTDAMNNQTTFAYDSWDRLLTITYPGNATTTFTYDYRGRRTSVTDQNSKKTTYAYDDADRLTSVTDPNNNVTYYTYDTENNLLSIEDANHNTTSFGYDAYGRVMQTTFPSTHYEQYGYDAANNLTSKTDRNGQTIGYVYDDLYRMTQKNYPNSTSVEYVYDLVGKLQQVTDPTGTYGFAYDNMGRLVGTTTQYTFVTGTYTNAYTYDADSNRASMTDPQDGVTSYVYDTLNRLSTLTPPTAFGSGSFGFSYDALNRRTQMTRPNGVTTNYTYNNLSQLLSVLHQVGTSTIDGAAYTVDPAGNRTAKTDMYANVTSNYTYDPLYELTQVTQATNTTESYSYDPVGNRLSSLGVSPYSVNTSNELTSTPSATYTYDNNGNTLTKVTSVGTTTYGWDYENRLKSVTLPGTGGTLAFKYDELGRRVQKVFMQNSTSTTTNYLYDGNNAVADVDQNGNVLARYTTTLNIDEPLTELRSNTASYYSQDGLGSITSLTTSTGALGNTYKYDSFGNVTASSGTIVNRFEYTAREFDSEAGLYFYRARYYDPSVGRFLGEDLIRFLAGPNFYSYVLNGSVTHKDAFGLSSSGDPCNSCPSSPSGWTPKTIGALLSGTAAAGAGPLGGTTATGAVGLVTSGSSTQLIASGGIGWSSGHYSGGSPSNQSIGGTPVTGSYGAYIGGGVSLTGSNGLPCQLRGTFHTINFDIGYGFNISGSIAFNDNGIWQITYGIPGASYGFGADLNFVNTNTAVSGP